jgi:hypothetical protein
MSSRENCLEFVVYGELHTAALVETKLSVHTGAMVQKYCTRDRRRPTSHHHQAVLRIRKQVIHGFSLGRIGIEKTKRCPFSYVC